MFGGEGEIIGLVTGALFGGEIEGTGIVTGAFLGGEIEGTGLVIGAICGDAPVGATTTLLVGLNPAATIHFLPDIDCHSYAPTSAGDRFNRDTPSKSTVAA